MTPARDIERVLEHWLDDGIDQMPDRVYLAILDRVERQPQRRAWRVSWRDSRMNTYLKPLLAVAAVIVIAVAGIAVIGRPSDSNVGGTSTPSPSPSPSVTPPESSGIVFPAWFTEKGNGLGILAAGGQTSRRFGPDISFTVPEGWVNSQDWAEYYDLFPDTPANEAEYALSNDTAQAIRLANGEDVSAICDQTGGAQGTTAAKMVDALVANEALATSEPVDVTIGGLSGRQIDVQLNPDWTSSCTLDPDDPPTRDFKDVRARIIALDTPDGSNVVITINSLYADAFQPFLGEAMPIVESIQFDLGQ